MNNVYVVGLTGPTGAGKSTVAAAFAEYGIKSIDADKVAREITQPGSPALSELTSAFGEDILNSDGTLNRMELAARAFKNERTTKLLNDITHPLIIMKIRRMIKELGESGEKIVIIDAPLLFESGIDSMCDKTVAVVADIDTRYERILARDHLSNKEARQRMSAQNEAYYYISKADFVIENNAGKQELREAVAKAEQKIRSFADESRA